jgi:hypothetical protein
MTIPGAQVSPFSRFYAFAAHSVLADYRIVPFDNHNDIFSEYR